MSSKHDWPRRGWHLQQLQQLFLLRIFQEKHHRWPVYQRDQWRDIDIYLEEAFKRQGNCFR